MGNGIERSVLLSAKADSRVRAERYAFAGGSAGGVGVLG